MIMKILRKYGELVYLSAKFIGGILIVVFPVNALLVVISGGTINFSAIPMFLEFWVSMSLVLPLILIGVSYLVARFDSM